MSKLAAPIELDPIAFTPDQIREHLGKWSAKLAKAKAESNTAEADIAREYLDRWLDRMNFAS